MLAAIVPLRNVGPRLIVMLANLTFEHVLLLITSILKNNIYPMMLYKKNVVARKKSFMVLGESFY